MNPPAAPTRVSPTAPPATTLTYTAVRLSDDVDPLAVYAVSDEATRAWWAGRDGGVTFAAVGVAADLVADAGTTADAFRSIARSRLALGARLRATSAVGPKPVLVGGFAFDHRPGPGDDRWRGHPAGRMVLPALLVVRYRDGDVWAICSGPADRATSGWDGLDELLERACRWRPPTAGDGEPGGAGPRAGAPIPDDDALGDDGYPRLVAAALADIDAGLLEKVVLARAVDMSVTVDVPALLAALGDRFPTCAVFGFTEGDATFLGATPELLVRVSGNSIETDALAGSRPRHADPARDAALGRDLLTDPKELAEHRFVVEALRRTLLGAGVVLDERPEPALRALPGIQHLITPVHGTMTSTATSAVALASRLHPSPAVGGTPGPAATRFIRDHEGLDRGWYAGPVGWIDLDGRGEFHVALRSGLVDRQGLRLFAGAGIVAGSDPDRELAETTVKLHAVLDSVPAALVPAAVRGSRR